MSLTILWLGVRGDSQYKINKKKFLKGFLMLLQIYLLIVFYYVGKKNFHYDILIRFAM